RQPRQRQRHQWRAAPHVLARLGRGALGVAVTVVATAAGVGWLYLLFQWGALDAGPHVSGALPLQQLAGNEAQPLLRVAVAWLPAGVAAGAALTALTRMGWVARGAEVGLGLQHPQGGQRQVRAPAVDQVPRSPAREELLVEAHQALELEAPADRSQAGPQQPLAAVERGGRGHDVREAGEVEA